MCFVLMTRFPSTSSIMTMHSPTEHMDQNAKQQRQHVDVERCSAHLCQRHHCCCHAQSGLKALFPRWGCMHRGWITASLLKRQERHVLQAGMHQRNSKVGAHAQVLSKCLVSLRLLSADTNTTRMHTRLSGDQVNKQPHVELRGTIVSHSANCGRGSNHSGPAPDSMLKAIIPSPLREAPLCSFFETLLPHSAACEGRPHFSQQLLSSFSYKQSKLLQDSRAYIE